MTCMIECALAMYWCT